MILYLRQRHGVVARVMLCRIDVKDAFHQIPVDPLHAAKIGYVFYEHALVDLFLQFEWRSSPGFAAKFSHVFDEYAAVDLFLQFWWRSSPSFWELAASSLEHAHNQTSFRDAVDLKHGRSVVGHVRMDADTGWETMPIPSDCERVPSAGVVAASPDAGRETMSIPSDCERASGSGITAGVTDAGWKTMSIPPNCVHIPCVNVAAGAPSHDQETMPIPSDFERVPGNGCDAGDPFFVRFYVDDGILVDARFFQDRRRLRRAIESVASDPFRLLGPRGPRPPPCWKRIRFWSGVHVWRY